MAVTYAPKYLAEHAQAIREDLPRVPLPESMPSLEKSAELGHALAVLLDVEKSVLGVTSGKLRKELSLIGRITGPKSSLSLTVAAGWSHFQKDNDVVMPGKGELKERAYSGEELAALTEGCADLGLTPEKMASLLGDKTVDVYLNGSTYWSNVPAPVWSYTIGGYQVLKKWLSYREHAVLGRDLTKDEAREFTHMVRRIAALILLEPQLDANYEQTVEKSFDWRNV